MTEYLTEEEQIEALKRWVKEYSLVIIAGAAMALLATWGLRYWEQRQNKTLTHASAVYDEMINLRAQNNDAAAKIQAEKLVSHYPKTVYSVMASLILARDAVNAKNYAEANQRLNWSLKHASSSALKQLTSIRLARLKMAENKPDEALKFLASVQDKSFVGLIEEIKGDAYVMLKNTKLARAAYQSALTELPNAETMRPILQMKYDNLAT